MVKRPGGRNIVIEDALWLRLKVAAVKRGKTLWGLLAEIIEEWLQREES